MIKPKEVLLGVKVPSDLKKNVSIYCDRNGVKIKYFVTQAIKEKLIEYIEDDMDNAEADKRLKNPKFTTEEHLKKYIQKRKKNN